jgi:hypothetical protein
MENSRIGTRDNRKEWKSERELDRVRWSMTNHRLMEEDPRERDTWRMFWVRENYRTMGIIG